MKGKKKWSKGRKKDKTTNAVFLSEKDLKAMKDKMLKMKVITISTIV